MTKIKQTIGAVLTAGAVILAVWTGWTAWGWCVRVDRRLEALTKRFGEMELRLFEVDQRNLEWGRCFSQRLHELAENGPGMAPGALSPSEGNVKLAATPCPEGVCEAGELGVEPRLTDPESGEAPPSEGWPTD